MTQPNSLIPRLWLAGLLGLLGTTVMADPAPAYSDRVASEVAGQSIWLSDLLDRTAKVFKNMQISPPSPGRPLDDQQLGVLEQSLRGLEQEILIAKEAARLQVTVSPAELDRAFDQVAVSNGLTRADLIAQLGESGHTEASYRIELEGQLLRMKLFAGARSKIVGRPGVGEKEIAAAEKAWLDALSKRGSIVRHVNLGAQEALERPSPKAAGVCQGLAGLPVFRWALTAQPPALQTGTLARITQEGLANPLAPHMAARIQARAGDPLSVVTIKADLGRLWATGAFDDVAASTRNEKEGLVLVYSLQARPKIRHVSLEAAGVLRESVMVGSLGAVEGQVLVPARFRSGQARLLEDLQQAGYIQASLEVRHRKVDPQGVDLCVRVQPGPKYRHAGLRFDGNNSLTAEILQACLGEQPSGPSREEGWLIQQRLATCAYDRGFIAARFSGPAPTIDHQARTITQVIEVTEGKVYVLASLEVVGDLLASVETYRSRLRLKTGSVFSRAQLAKAIQRIQDMHAAYGRGDLEVLPETQIDTDAGRIGIVLRISKR